MYILWPFDTSDGQLVNFSRFWYIVERKIWQPCSGGAKGTLFRAQRIGVD
jgi:hypothetical protein